MILSGLYITPYTQVIYQSFLIIAPIVIIIIDKIIVFSSRKNRRNHLRSNSGSQQTSKNLIKRPDKKLYCLKAWKVAGVSSLCVAIWVLVIGHCCCIRDLICHPATKQPSENKIAIHTFYLLLWIKFRIIVEWFYLSESKESFVSTLHHGRIFIASLKMLITTTKGGGRVCSDY